MRAAISDYRGSLRVTVTAETIDEEMLLRAFLREHHLDKATLFVVPVDHTHSTVTFGKEMP